MSGRRGGRDVLPEQDVLVWTGGTCAVVRALARAAWARGARYVEVEYRDDDLGGPLSSWVRRRTDVDAALVVARAEHDGSKREP